MICGLDSECDAGDLCTWRQRVFILLMHTLKVKKFTVFYVYNVLLSPQAGRWENVFLFDMDMMDMLFMNQQRWTLSNKAFLWNNSHNVQYSMTEMSL